MTRMKAALVGPGWWANHSYFPALKARADVDLSAVVGIDEREARSAAEKWSVPHAYTDLDALLNGEDKPDLAVITAPNHLHAAYAKKALLAGVAVFCEKPLGNSSAETGELVRLAKSTGVKNTVGLSFRYVPALQRLYHDIRDGVYGDPWYLELFESNPMFHPDRCEQVNWKRDPNMTAAGVLSDFCPHVIDMANWLIGAVQGVNVNYASVLEGPVFDDIIHLQFAFHRGCMGSLTAGWVLPGVYPGIRIVFHGSKGSCRIDLTTALDGGMDYRPMDLDGVLGDPIPLEPPFQKFNEQVALHLGEFIASIKGEPLHYADTLPTFEDGALVQDVIETAICVKDEIHPIHRFGI